MRLDTPPVRDFGRPQPTGSSERHRDMVPSSPTCRRPLLDGVAVTVGVGAAPMSAEPPLDAARVAAIQAAIHDGTYPFQPDRVASAMIAANPLLSVHQ